MREGYCVAIEGGVDAALLCDYMESFNDPEAYAMSHIGWGRSRGRAGRRWRCTTASDHRHGCARV